jgi:outer membrane lipoprotein SlyB
MSAQVLIEPTTSAVTTPAFIQVVQKMIPGTLIADGLATTEEVQILISIDDGDTNRAVQQEGSVLVLTATDFVKTINSPMTVGVTKDATVGATGVFFASHLKV